MIDQSKEVIKRLEGHLTNDEYLNVNGFICPFCRNPATALRIVKDPLTGTRPIMRFSNKALHSQRLIECDHCKVKYWDDYQLSGFSEYSPGDENKDL